MANKRGPETKSADPDDSGIRVISSVVAALFLARWFLPAEAPDLGVTLWITFLTLGIVAFGSWWRLRAGERAASWNGIDSCMALLVGGHLVSTCAVLLSEGDRRAALNIGWEWLALGAQYAWFRQGTAYRPSRPVMVWTLLVLACLGLWQHHVWYPQVGRALDAALGKEVSGEVDADLKAQMAAQLQGLDDVGQQLLISRLRDSTEPLARFSLANTLGGVLAVGVFLAISLVVASPVPRRWGVAFWGLSALLLGDCLLLTKSRTAYVGVMCGAAYLLLAVARSSTPEIKKYVVKGLTLVLVLGVLAGSLLVTTGSLDREVLTESTKSLQYRLEYWQSSLGVLWDRPLLGTGPGNFRQHYLSYKLPQSSEEILDPHNQFLDVWVNGGLLALAGLCGLWLLVLRSLIQGLITPAIVPSTAPGEARRLTPTVLISAGLLMSFEWLLNTATNSGDWLLYGVWVGGALLIDSLGTAWSTRQPGSSDQGSIGSSVFLGSGWLALSLHLCGAGGIGMVAVIQLWLWVILERVPSSQENGPSPTTDARSSGSGFLDRVQPLLWGVAALGCAVTALIPNTLSQGAQDLARASMLGAVPSSLARRTLEEAIVRDPLAPEPPQALGELLIHEWQRGGASNEEQFQEAIRLQKLSIARDPFSPKRYRVLGEYWWGKYLKTGEADAAREALQAYAQAAARYPYHVRILASYALALDAAGDDARSVARQALELQEFNRQLGHTDKLLPEEVLAQLKTLLKVP